METGWTEQPPRVVGQLEGAEGPSRTPAPADSPSITPPGMLRGQVQPESNREQKRPGVLAQKEFASGTGYK